MIIRWTKAKTVVAVSVLALLAVILTIKWLWFPSVDDKFFQLDFQRLQTAPANVFILRPTRFADSRRTGCLTAGGRSRNGDYQPRILGRNVTLREIIPTAHQCPMSHIVYPADLPTNRYDLLVTLRRKPVERLQSALQRRFGYTASWQEREVDVWLLRVAASRRSGLRVSSATSGEVNFKNGRMTYTHQSLAALIGPLEAALKQPVRDQTGLTDFYDFSIPWNWRAAEDMTVQDAYTWLSALGLTLQRGKETMSMLVVEKVK